MVELIEGTALPMYAPGTQRQTEGRSPVQQENQQPSLFEKIASRDGISPAEQAVVAAALRAYDRAPKRRMTVYPKVSGTTDATTGSIVLELFEVPAGWQAHLTQVTVDCPGSSTITPAAPFASASSWMFLAVSSRTQRATVPTTIRAGAVAFAPSSAGGAILPGQWTFNDTSSPVGRGGQFFYFALVGGSQAGLTSLQVTANARVNLVEYGEGL